MLSYIATMELLVVRRAIHLLADIVAKAPITAAAYQEFSAASLVYPYASLVIAPGLALHTGSAADLPRQLHSAADISVAIVAVLVVGVAANHLAVAVIAVVVAAVVVAAVVVITAANEEFGAASFIHPYASLVIAPGLTLHTGRAADLPRKLHAAAYAGIAIVAIAIVGVAANGLAIAAIGVARHKLRATSFVHPYAVLVSAPAPISDAGRATDLPRKLHAGAHIGGAVMAVAIVRATANRVLGLLTRVILRECGGWNHTVQRGQQKTPKDRTLHVTTSLP